MNAQEAIAYLESDHYSAMRLGLERITELLERMGEPQKKLKFVHVAGTNGKGSACAMLSSVLTEAGYKTGLYTSPYLCVFNERIQINGQNIPDGDLARLTEEIRPVAAAMDDHPSQFELITALAFQYFYEQHCDIVVLEVGMGGATDGTNVIGCPEAAVLMNMGLEHTEYLGDTIEAIAGVKAGIIKPGCDAVCYRGQESVEQVFAQRCAAVGATLHKADFAAIEPLSHDLGGQRFRWGEFGELSLPLLGAHQLCNAATVLTTLRVLRSKGWRIPDEAVRQGLAHTEWIARFEVLSRQPLFIVDGGHNPQCAQAMADMIKEYLPGRPLTFLLGVLADKDYPQMLSLIWPYAQRFLCLTPQSGRALPAADLAEFIRQRGKEAECCPSIEAGVDRALELGGDTLCFGSLYMAGWARKRYIEVKK